MGLSTFVQRKGGTHRALLALCVSTLASEGTNDGGGTTLLKRFFANMRRGVSEIRIGSRFEGAFSAKVFIIVPPLHERGEKKCGSWYVVAVFSTFSLKS